MTIQEMNKLSNEGKATKISTPKAPQGDGFLKTIAKGIMTTPARVASTSLALAQAPGLLATGQRELAMKRLKEGYNVPVVGQAKPYAIGKDVEDGGYFGKETAETVGAGLEIGSYLAPGAHAVSTGAKAFQAAKAAPSLSKALRPLGKAALIESGLGGFGGGVGGVGVGLQQEGATPESVLESAAIGTGFGVGVGALSPFAGGIAGRVFKPGANSLDTAIDTAFAHQSKKTPVSSDNVVQAGPTTVLDYENLTPDLQEIIPEPAPGSRPMDEKLVKKAEQLGFKKTLPYTVSSMGDAEREAAREIIRMAEKRQLNEFAPHPMERAADSVVRQISNLEKAGEAAGKSLDDLVDAMPDAPLSLVSPKQAFNDFLVSNNIKVTKDGLDFSGSKFWSSVSANDQKIIAEVYKKLGPIEKEVLKRPKEIRAMRQGLREISEKLQKSTDPYSNAVKAVIDDVRQMLNEPLTQLSSEYDKANRTYAISRSALEAFKKYLGKDFFDASPQEIRMRIAEILPRLISGVPGKANVMLNMLKNASKSIGLPIEAIDDPRRLISFAQIVEDAYGIQPRRGFTGSVATGVQKAVEDVGLVADVVPTPGNLNPMKAMGTMDRLINRFGTPLNEKRINLLKEMLELGSEEATPPTSATVPPRGGQEAFGAVAGLEPEFDEEGNPIGMKYDPVKGALGVAGGIAVGKMGKKKAIQKVADNAFQGFEDLSTKTLEKLKGRTTVSKQFIEDLAKAPDLKQQERDVIASVLEEMTSAPKIPEYGMSHRPSFEGMPPAYNLLEGDTLPRDVYSHPEYSIASGRDLRTDKSSQESWKVLQEIKGNPDAEVTVYRAAPKNELNPGDWVSFSKTYAKGEGVAEGSKVYPFKVKAQDVIFAGDDINEFGYYPKANDKINVQEFADKVKAELLPLERVSSYGGEPRYENVSLPSELRGPIKEYSEHVYNSPIKTSAGKVHFGDEATNYFGHTRVEDLPYDQPITTPTPGAVSFRKTGEGKYGAFDKHGNLLKEEYEIGKEPRVRRVIEVQSDLYQRGRLEQEGKRMSTEGMFEPFGSPKSKTSAQLRKERDAEIAKLQQYSNPTAHFRMIREEVKRAAQDGKTKLQFPTGETAMKIEGLGEQSLWVNSNDYRLITRDRMSRQAAADHFGLRPDDLRVGKEVKQFGDENTSWIITDVLGDGKFKAVPNRSLEFENEEAVYNLAMKKGYIDKEDGTWDMVKATSDPDILKKMADSYLSETFDISGKVDKENPIYKFYDKEVASYIRKKYGATRVKDAQGVEWWEIDVKPEMGKGPVEAFAAVPLAGAGAMGMEKEKKKKTK